LKEIGARQYVDWCEYRSELNHPNVHRAIAAFCRTIVATLEREAPDPPVEAENQQVVPMVRSGRLADNVQEKRSEPQRHEEDATHTASHRHQAEESRTPPAQEKPQSAVDQASTAVKSAAAPSDIQASKIRHIIGVLIIAQGLLWEIGILAAESKINEIDTLALVTLPFIAIMYVGTSILVRGHRWIIAQTLIGGILACVTTFILSAMIISKIISSGFDSKVFVAQISILTGVVVSIITIVWSSLVLRVRRVF
jgi:cation transport ATPase